MTYTIFKHDGYSRDPDRICLECGRPAKEHWMYGDSVFGEFRCPTTDKKVMKEFFDATSVVVTGNYPVKRSTIVGKIKGVK